MLTTSLFFLTSCNENVSPFNTNMNSTPSIVSTTPSISETKNSIESNTQGTISTVLESSFDACSITLKSGQSFNYYLYTPKKR